MDIMKEKIKSMTDAKLALALLSLDDYEPAAAELVKQEAQTRNMVDADMNFTPKHQESVEAGFEHERKKREEDIQSRTYFRIAWLIVPILAVIATMIIAQLF